MSDTVQNDSVVAMHYTLRDSEGTIIDESPEGQPLLYLHGHENIVPGLERELTGAKAGDEKDVVVAPKDGYGEREDQMVLEVPRDQLPEDMTPEVGMILEMQSDQGFAVPVTITALADSHVTMDANHELAGVTLHFKVKIDSVRPASAEELEHGHVHGVGGHEH